MNHWQTGRGVPLHATGAGRWEPRGVRTRAWENHIIAPVLPITSDRAGVDGRSPPGINHPPSGKSIDFRLSYTCEGNNGPRLSGEEVPEWVFAGEGRSGCRGLENRGR